MNFTDFLLREYECLRQESRHNDSLRAQMIRFFITIIVAIFGILLVGSKLKPELPLPIDPTLLIAVLVLVNLLGVLVLVFHAFERSKNKENDYTFDVIRSAFWQLGEAEMTEKLGKKISYNLPKEPPCPEKINFWAWGTDFVYSVALTLINVFLALSLVLQISPATLRDWVVPAVPLSWGVLTYLLGYAAVLKHRQNKLRDFLLRPKQVMEAPKHTASGAST
jgi:hypothetical protein